MKNLQTIAQLFSERLLVVPDYQRGYAWEEKQCQDFIEDLEVLPKGKEHFFGTLVIQQHDASDGKIMDRGGRFYDRYDIIDGQQRLTTVVLFLHVIQQEMRRLGGDVAEFTGDLQRNYLWTKDRNRQPLVKLSLNQETQDLFQQLISGQANGISTPKIQSAKRLLFAREYLAKYLRTQQQKRGEAYEEWLEKLYFKITGQLLLIVYSVKSEAEAGIIFETMNNRGKPLTELEKVKNYLLYLVGRLHLPAPHRLDTKINKTWQHIYQSLTAASLASRAYEDQLLRVHWLMGYDYQTQNWHGYESIKNQFDLRDYDQRHEELLDDLRTYLESLKIATTAYCDIQRPNDAYRHLEGQPELRQKIIEMGSRLVRVGSLATFLPLLIAARMKQSAEIYLQLIDLCEKYAFRVYRWKGLRSNTGQSRIFRFGHELYNGREGTAMVDDLRREISNRCSDSDFEARFQEGHSWYPWSGLKYFLYEYEHHLAGDKGVRMSWEFVTKSKDSIEHILPQTMGRDGYWQERFTTEAHEQWIHDIGNLTLTQDNSPLSNRPFPDKKEIYAKSHFVVERQLDELPEWDIEHLKKRREAIKVWALQRWYVEPPAQVERKEESSGRTYSREKIRALADKNRVADIFDQIIGHAEQYGLGIRAWKHSITISPPKDGRYALVYIQPKPGHLSVGVWRDNIPKFFDITKEEIQAIMGSDYWHQVDSGNINSFLDSLGALFEVCGLTPGILSLQK